MSKDNSLAHEIPYRYLLRNGLVDLYEGGLMAANDFIGPSPEISDAFDLQDRSARLAAGAMHLGTGDTIYAIFHRLPAPEPFQHTYSHQAAALVDADRRAQFSREEHWLTPSRLYLGHQQQSLARTWLEAVLHARDMPEHQRQRELAREYAQRRLQAFEDTVAGAVTLRRMGDEELFRALLMDVTYNDYPAALPEPGVKLNQVIGAMERQINGTKPMMGEYHLRVMTVVLYPGLTFPQLLAVLLKEKGRIVVSARFHCLDGYDAQQELENEKSYWNRTGFESWRKFLAKWNAGGAETDTHAAEMKADINAAMAEAAAGTVFGHAKLTIIVLDKDADRALFRIHNLRKECYAMGVKARIETIHAPTAIMETWPGYVLTDTRKNAIRIRTPLISMRNFADMILPARSWDGLPYIDSEMYAPQTPTPIVLGGSGGGSPFHFPTHVNGVAHMVVIGPTTVGKTTLEGALICAYLGIPDVRITCFDSGYSSWPLAHMLGADYYEIGSEDTPALCPLSLLDTPHGGPQLFGWFERMFGRFNFQMEEDQVEDLAYALRHAQREGIRTLSEFRASIKGGERRQRMREILRLCVTDWKHIFDGKPSEHQDNPITFYEISQLIELGDQAAGPAMELMLESTTAKLNGKPAWIFADEWHQLLAHKISIQWFKKALRTFRRLNCGFVGFTQSLSELIANPDCNLMLESFYGRVFLPNHAANSEFVRDMYRSIGGLDDNKIALIASAHARSEAIYDSIIGTRKFKLELGAIARAIIGSTGYPDVQRARAIYAESTPELFLENWLAERVPGWQPRLPLTSTTAAAAGR